MSNARGVGIRESAFSALLAGAVALTGCDAQKTPKSSSTAEDGGGSNSTPSPEGVDGAGRTPQVIITPPEGIHGHAPEVIITPIGRDAGTRPACGNGVLDPGETCEPGLQACCNDTCNGQRPKDAICRAADGGCDLAELCDGTSVDCPADALAARAAECRAVAGECDVAELCDGTHKECPADGFKSATTVCRAGDGECDLAESCTGSGPACPADAVATGELRCRDAVGDCDKAEFCDGASKICPADAVADSGTVCRASPASALCDAPEVCDGQGKDCPVQTTVVAQAGAICRQAAGPCDEAEMCDGTSTDCPPDRLKSVDDVCRSTSGPCDATDYCTGNSVDCPDRFAQSGTVCRAAVPTDLCDVDDTCTGDSAACNAQFRPSGYVCLAANGLCDIDDTCTGSSPTCTAQFHPSGYVCLTANGPCDIDDTCTGSSATCTAQYLPSGYVCNAANGSCDIDDTCTGSSTGCAAQYRPGGYVCNPANGPCDLDDTCTGNSTGCAAQVRPSGSVCNSALSDACDRPDTCDGTSSACLSQRALDGDPCNAGLGACWSDICCPGVTQPSGSPLACTLGAGRDVVFVTTAGYPGALGGLGAADKHCNDAATSANLGGTYHAWLSTFGAVAPGINAIDRISNGPYARVDGAVVASNKTDLTDAALSQPIQLTEAGASLDTKVWTSTLPDGTTTGQACGNWTTSNGSGVYGSSSAVNGTWTDLVGAAGTSCDTPLSLYCFQDDCPGVPTVDFQNDPANCGACGRTCKTGQSCIRGRCGGYVFVSSTQVAGAISSGNFRGLQAADDVCMMRAQRAQLPGSYTAWLSTSVSPAPSRLVDGAFFRRDGALIAANLAGLLGASSKALVNPINLDESGNPAQATRVWTGTDSDGSPNAANCTDWTGFSGAGLWGMPTATDPQWTASQATTCDGSAALYCIETDSALLP